jgi:hypothetical protein
MKINRFWCAVIEPTSNERFGADSPGAAFFVKLRGPAGR